MCWKSEYIDSCCRWCGGLFTYAKQKSATIPGTLRCKWNQLELCPPWALVGCGEGMWLCSFSSASLCNLQPGLISSFDGPTVTPQVRTCFLQPTPTPSNITQHTRVSQLLPTVEEMSVQWPSRWDIYYSSIG